jgi:anti-sigma B factor antagonist
VKDTSPLGLRCEVEPDRERVVVRPVGEIDLATVGVVEAPLAELWTTGFAEIVLDLRWVSFMDSTGLRLIIRRCQMAEEDGKALRVDVDEASQVHRLLELTGLLDLLPITLLPAGPRGRAAQE